MKKYLLTFALAALAGSSYAATYSNGTVWSGKTCAPNAPAGFGACVANVTSVTTVGQLGRVYIDTSKNVWFSGTVSGTTGIVTPTVNLYLGSQLIGQQSVSLTTTGNIVGFPLNKPYFDNITVSISTPGLLGTSQSAVMGIIQN